MAKIHKCGLYIRVSTDEQADRPEGSLKNQRKRLEHFVQDNNQHAQASGTDEEWTVHNVYEEEPKSAKDTNRPKYQQLIADIDAGAVLDDTPLHAALDANGPDLLPHRV